MPEGRRVREKGAGCKYFAERSIIKKSWKGAAADAD